MVVLDLSLSIAEDELPGREACCPAADRRGRPGRPRRLLGRAVRAAPPGTPASELGPLLRVFAPGVSGRPNPWWGTFRAGTRISSALGLAREMLVRDGVDDGSIVLVSDLETAPDDVEIVHGPLASSRGRGSTCASFRSRRRATAFGLVEGILGDEGSPPLLLGPQAEPMLEAERDEPRADETLLLGGLLFAALAFYERFAGRLSLPRAGAEERNMTRRSDRPAPPARARRDRLSRARRRLLALLARSRPRSARAHRRRPYRSLPSRAASGERGDGPGRFGRERRRGRRHRASRGDRALRLSRLED